MISLPSFDIRYSELEDLSYLQKWFEDPSVCNDYPFGEGEKEEALKNWIGFSKFNASLTGTIEGVPCAIGTLFLMPYRKVAHHCSFYLFVDPIHRRRGIGGSMIRNLLNLAKVRFRLESVHVEFFEPSAIHSLLIKERFELIARQENFIQIGADFRPRILMERYFV
jgi:GNAT superfamily N-acetyltransferase